MSTENKEAEIIEGNRLIAEFMGYAVYPDDAQFMCAAMNHIKQKNVKPYHSSWDWLMPAFKKFRDLEGMPMLDWLVYNNTIENWIVRVNILYAHESLVKAIKWYNQQTK
jgi:hypothetical protein